MATDRAVSGVSAVAAIALRLTGAGLTAAMAAIHLHLWDGGYRDLATIGVLFLLNGIGGCLLALALLVAPARHVGAVAALTALFTAGTLAALVLSLTTGLFGFEETLDAELVRPTLVVESAGIVVLTALALLARVRLPRRSGLPRRPPT
ncbi:hypothetical protein [Streptomyces vilmorinianum]|uniref:hypothetical protein n=1 Tax=Streptomyces vilmorinianum TaxID=3051092 RepID=UPI0010FADC39|nr:hypothetical protein [Streptomyces vilmorinianum]